jgi:hypothetical protein
LIKPSHGGFLIIGNKENTMNNFEKRAKHICERKGGAFEQIDTMIEQIQAPRPRAGIAIEDLVLQPTFDSGTSHDNLTYEIRQNALLINRLAMTAIYNRYEVDPDKTVIHSYFGPPQTTELEPMTFMGVRLMGYRGGDSVTTDVQHFTNQGIGFYEQHEYSKRANPGIAVRRTHNPLEPFDVTTGYSIHEFNRVAAMPRIARFSVYEVVNGQFHGGLYDY